MNALGNLAGFFGPYAMGYMRDLTGNFDSGLWMLSVAGLVGMAMVLMLPHDGRLEDAPAVGRVPAE